MDRVPVGPPSIKLQMTLWDARMGSSLPSVALMSLLPLLLRGATAPLAGRPQHSLDGPWAFALVAGGAEPGWASPQPPAGAFFGSIAVPGTWGAQGWGEQWVCTHDGPAGTWNPCATPLPPPHYCLLTPARGVDGRRPGTATRATWSGTTTWAALSTART